MLGALREVALRWWTLMLLAACVSGPEAEIASGDYQFFTAAADDACLDGALGALFMPAGRDTPHPFEFPIYIPHRDETPLTYRVSFRAPFVGMPVTVEATRAGLAIRGSVMDAVRLSDSAYGNCDATMSVDADLWPGEDIAGEARISVSDPRGSDDRCPVFMDDPCQVTLDLRATRLGPGEPEFD